MRRGWLLGLVVGAWVCVASQAAALCVCGDRDGCASAAACSGSSPADACAPPQGGSCKIKVGLGTEAVCCCGCSRGQGPLSCQLDAPLAAVSALDTPPCDDAAAAKAARRAAATLRRGLTKSQARCLADKPGADRKLAAGLRGLSKLRTKLDKLVARGRLDEECAAAWSGVADVLEAAIAEVAEHGGRGVPPSTTTSTTLPPPALACQGTLAMDGGGWVRLRFACDVEPGLYTSFVVSFPGHTVVAGSQPMGFFCLPYLPTDTSHYWRCDGGFTLSTSMDAGAVVLDPPATSSTTASFVLHKQDGGDEGPFPMSWAD